MKFNDAVFESAAGTSKQLPESDMPEIVFSGRSNVGKSSLINKIINRKSLARVSAQPGKTVTINFYKLDKARLVDFPGYGYAKVSQSEKKRWGELVEGYFSAVFSGKRNLSLVVQLVDMRHPPSRDDVNMIHYLNDNNIPFIIVMTKSDKLNKSQREERLRLIDEELDFLQGHIHIIPFSAVKGEGVEDIRACIIRAAEISVD